MSWAPDYCTSDELKAYVRIPVDDTEDDDQVALAVTASSRAIDRATGRQFGNVDAPVDRFYTAQWRQPMALHGHWQGEIDDLMDITDMVVALDEAGDETFSTVLTTTDFVLLDRNAPADARPWTGIRLQRSVSFVVPFPFGQRHHGSENMKITAAWGWTSVPPTIKNATLLQGSRLLSRRDSPYGVAGSPEAGNEIRLLPKLDPDVALMVRPYYRWWGAR